MNWRVLSTAFKAVSDVLTEMHKADRKLPDTNESQALLMAMSNILKTGVVDIPGVDEYQLSLDLDKFSSSLIFSIEDSKTKKYHDLMLVRKEKK